MYERQYWVDHVVSPQHIYTLEDNGDGTQTITQAGDVIQEGTPMDQAHFNHMEEGIEKAHQLIEELTEKVDEGVGGVYTDNGNSFDGDGLNVNPEGGEMATKVDGEGLKVQQKETGQEIFSVKGSEATAKNLNVTDSVTLFGALRAEMDSDGGLSIYYFGG